MSVPATTKPIIPPSGALAAEQVMANLRAARNEIGSGDEGQGLTLPMLKIDQNTGQLTYGKDREPLPPNHRFAVPITGMRYGYLVWKNKQVVERNMVPHVQGARPHPPNGHYVDYPDDGPRKSDEIQLNSVEERGFNIVFPTSSISNANRMGNISDSIVAQMQTQDGAAGFLNPVIVMLPASSYHHKKYSKTIWTFEYELVDWLHNDGETFLSQQGGKIAAQPAAAEAAAEAAQPAAEGATKVPPWEREDDDGEDPTAMTDEEREFLNPRA